MRLAWAVMLSGALTMCGGQQPHGRVPATPLSGPVGWIQPETIQRIVRARFSVFEQCYLAGVLMNSNLAGRVAVKFIIDPTGKVATAVDAGSSMPDPAVTKCVVDNFLGLSFPHPQPEGGHVTVVYPIQFKPR